MHSFSSLAVIGPNGLSIEDRKGLRRWANLIGQGVELILTLEEAKEARSQRALRYYFGVVVAAACERYGYSRHQMHGVFKALYLPDIREDVRFYNVVTGETVTIPVAEPSTKGKSRAAFYDFVEQCRHHLELDGVVTPDPDPAYWRTRKAKA